MKKILIWVLLFCTMPAANFAQSTSQSKANKEARKALADSLENAWKGQRKWLKIDVLKRKYFLGGEDVTYIYYGGKIQYKGILGNPVREIESTSAEEFAIKTMSIVPSEEVNLFERGIPVILHSVKFGETIYKEAEIKIGVTGEENGEKTSIKFIFPNDDFVAKQIQKSFAIAFSDSDWSDASTPRAIGKKLIGQKKWIKIDNVNVRGGISDNSDGAAYIFPNGKIYYRIQYSSSRQNWSYQTESTVEFENEVRHRLPKYSTELWSKGTQATIYAVGFLEKWKKSDYHAEIGIANFRGDKTSIKVVFDFNGNTVEQFQRAVAIAFADSESELHETGQTTKLSLGMSIDDVIKMKGQPKTRADLGSKTVFTYDDVKIIFQDGKLADVQ